MADAAWWDLWEAGLAQGQVLPDTVAAMRAQPGFRDALAWTVRSALRRVDEDPEFHRTLPDMESLVLGVVALHLDATGGLTHRRLREVIGLPGVLSAGRVTALLLRMQAIGFVRAEREHRPGTQKVYRPTPRMVQVFHSWAGDAFDALALMAPEMGELRARLDAPGGLADFMGVMGRIVIDGVKYQRADDEGRGLAAIERIGIHRGGLLALITLLDAAAARTGRFPAPGAVEISVLALARRCLVSRSHMLRVLRQAEAHGLIRRGATEIEVLPALVEAVERLYADIYLRMAVSAHRALAGPARA